MCQEVEVGLRFASGASELAMQWFTCPMYARRRAVPQTSDNTSWNDCGRPPTPGHLGHLLITPHCDQICQQPTQRTSACDYGTGIALTIRILDLADRKQIATRLPCLYYIPQRDR
jgi:hypothetical protein